MRDPPTGTVTFLFTDIEGSTRWWEERRDEMRAALDEHDAPRVARTDIYHLLDLIERALD
jgi:class 3 adenylate cyclase